MPGETRPIRVALIEAGSPGLNIYSHIAMGRGLPILATVLAAAGVDTRAFIEDISGKGSIDWEYVSKADVVGFSSITCTLPRTAELVAQTRKVNPEAVVVLGGPEPTLATERAFQAGADYVLRGEAELTLPQFVRAIAAQRARDGRQQETRIASELGAIPGLVWREEGRLRFGPAESQLSRDVVDSLPLIDTSLVHGYENRTTGLVWRSRGCPERCEFCEVHEMWPHYVLRDESISVQELMRCQDEGCAGVFLVDDNSAANKPSFKRFLRSAIERGFALPLTVQLRADAVFDRAGRLDWELLRLLKDVAPVTVLCVGVESASDSDLAEIGKRDTSKRMATALRAMRRYGLLVHGMMIAFANDTAETLARNGRYARRYVTSLQYLFETPLPGTKRTAAHEAADRILWREFGHLKFFDGMHIAVRPEHMTSQEMQRILTDEYHRFYSRARVVRALLGGVFLRHRRLSSGQRALISQLRGWRRARTWLSLHLQYKFAPWAFLRIGRRRILAMLRDADYLHYLQLLDT